MQDCHGAATQHNAAPIQDDTQNYMVKDGFQNATHTQVEFYRSTETCDPYDLALGVSLSDAKPNLADLFLNLPILQSETVKVLWSFGDTDPIHGNLKGHGKNRGYKSLHLIGPMFRKNAKSAHESHKWDVTVQNASYLKILLTNA